MSFEQSRKVRLTTFFGWLAIACTTPYVFIFFARENPLRYLILGFVGLLLGVIVLNKKGHHIIAKHLFFISANLFLFITASSFGREAGEQFIFFPIIFGTVLIYEFSEIRSLIFSIVFMLTCFVILEVTDYNLLTLHLTHEEQLEHYYGNMVISFGVSVTIALFYFTIYAKQNIINETQLHNARETEKIINYFSTSLYGKNTVDEILWDIAKNCISQFGFQDCVIYLLNEETGYLEQRAAYGPKNPAAHEITNCIQIPLGRGIVGTVGKTGKAEIVADTTKDDRYILDDKLRYSEITVPILSQNKVIGVIDAEHEEKNFFNASHLNLLTTIAALGSNKIMKAIAEEEKLAATIQQMEVEKIKELDKVKSQFFNQISHEFRTPLTLILGPLDEMIRSCRDDGTRRDLKVMYANGHKLLQLINELIQVSKLNEGMPALNSKPADIYQIIHHTIANHKPFAHQKDVKIAHNLPERPHILILDEAQIETILTNLLSNALKFAPPQSSILINACEKKDEIEITIDGTGPEPPDIEEITTQYGWEDSPLREGEGYGMGLELSRKLAVLHGGNVRVESHKSRYCFILSIPANGPGTTETATHAAGETAMPIPDPAPSRIDMDVQNTRNPVVLVIEDSDYLRAFLCRILSRDFELMEAADGEEGLKISLQHVPDLIISDIMMPRMDGLELCRKVKSSEVTSHIPVLLLTALADIDSKVTGLETGADYYLPKPFEPRELLTASHNLIQQRKNLREHFSKKILLRSQQLDNVSADDRFLQKLILLIEKNIGEPDLKVEDLLKDLGVSRMQLHRKLKALTDKSATDFIRTIRLKKAADLLLTGQDNVSQVAYQVGFSSLSYFTKCFKEQFGTPPSVYQEKKSSPAS